MLKELGSRAKRNRIVNYMDTFPEEFEVLADNLDYSDPMIKLQTKTRNIFLKCDNEGHVIEDFRMRPGAGSKEEFLLKQEAYTAVRKYYDDFYTSAKIKQASFDDGFIKLELETKIITLLYDAETKCVEEKERARRGTKQNNSITGEQGTGMTSMLKATTGHIDENELSQIKDELKLKETYPNKTIDIFEKPKRHRRTKAELMAAKSGFTPNTNPDVQKLLDQVEANQYEQLDITEFLDGNNDVDADADFSVRKYEKIPEGAIVKTLYSSREYKVVKTSETNVLEVFDKDHGYLTLARSDIEILVNIPGMKERN